MPSSLPIPTNVTTLDGWFVDHLVCPRDHRELALSNGCLTCSGGHFYPIVKGVPVMLLDDVPETLDVMSVSAELARCGRAGDDTNELFLETLGISAEERQGAAQLAARGEARVDPVVSFLVAATNGIMYRQLVGKLESYPVPELPLHGASGKTLLDIGCSWGRWCIAAARKGYAPVGLDPSLGAVLAARRVATQLGVSARFVVGDARWLPFREDSFQTVFSYSVIQHFSYDNARKAVSEISRVLESGGSSLVQLPNALGLRCLYHQLRRGFRSPAGFEVRYWTPMKMRRTFEDLLGETQLSPDCFFGIGLQVSDLHMMPPAKRVLITASEFGKRMNAAIGCLTVAAESIWITARKSRPA
jgi:SAM-dependent methyltransferase/uncharacterized protein YbaR (Trm112 family)